MKLCDIIATDNTEETVKERTKAYLAGIIDGEGSFTIYSSPQDGYDHYISQMRAYGTDKRLMKWIVKHFGGSFFICRPETEKYKAEWTWQHSGQKHGMAVLSHFQPYLQIKKRQADVMAAYWSLTGQKCPEKRADLKSQMNTLNSELEGRSSVTTDTFDFPFRTNLINAYFGGIVDGEGGLYITKTKMDWGHHYTTKVTVTNYQLPLLLAMKRIYGGRIDSKGVVWLLDNHDAQERFLLKMLPYLVIKREHANALLQFIRLKGKKVPAERDVLFRLVKKLNGKMIQSELAGDRESAPVETQVQEFSTHTTPLADREIVSGWEKEYPW